MQNDAAVRVGWFTKNAGDHPPEAPVRSRNPLANLGHRLFSYVVPPSNIATGGQLFTATGSRQAASYARRWTGRKPPSRHGDSAGGLAVCRWTPPDHWGRIL